MKYFSVGTGPDWVEISTIEQSNISDKHFASVKQTLSEILMTDNLVTLTGLGTSLCITDCNSKRAAPTMLDLWEAIEKESETTFTKILEAVRYDTKASGKNIELLLSSCHIAQRFHPKKIVETFVTTAEQIIVDKCKFITPDTPLTIHEIFLRKVARRPVRLPRLKLFTTNYDLAFETAAGRAKFVVIDGFSHTLPQEFDGTFFDYDLVKRTERKDIPNYIPNVFHLCKLHGSIDWESNSSQIIKTNNAVKPLIIYPRSSKFENAFDQPYLEMMSRFQATIRQSNIGVIVVGFGFNDPHIARPLLQAIKTNVSMRAIVIAPDLEQSKNPFIDEIKGLIQSGDWRLALLNATFEDLVKLIPDFVSKTENELHSERLRAAEIFQ